MFPAATVRSSSPSDRGSEAEDPPALPLLGKRAHFLLIEIPSPLNYDSFRHI